MSRPFIDSNVAVYAFSEDLKSIAADAVLRLAPVMSVQTLNEFTNVARRKLKFDWPTISDAIEQLMILCPIVVKMTLDTHIVARRLAERYTLAIYDANALASALEARCDTFFSEDMHDGLVIEDRLTVRNPFA